MNKLTDQQFLSLIRKLSSEGRLQLNTPIIIDTKSIIIEVVDLLTFPPKPLLNLYNANYDSLYRTDNKVIINELLILIDQPKQAETNSLLNVLINYIK